MDFPKASRTPPEVAEEWSPERFSPADLPRFYQTARAVQRALRVFVRHPKHAGTSFLQKAHTQWYASRWCKYLYGIHGECDWWSAPP
jgi:hypothetical protein